MTGEFVIKKIDTYAKNLVTEEGTLLPLQDIADIQTDI